MGELLARRPVLLSKVVERAATGDSDEGNGARDLEEALPKRRLDGGRRGLDGAGRADVRKRGRRRALAAAMAGAAGGDDNDIPQMRPPTLLPRKPTAWLTGDEGPRMAEMRRGFGRERALEP